GRCGDDCREVPRLAVAAERHRSHWPEWTFLPHWAAVVVDRHVACETRSIRHFQRNCERRRTESLKPFERGPLLGLLAGFAPGRSQRHEYAVRMRRPFRLRTVVDASHDGTAHQ